VNTQTGEEYQNDDVSLHFEPLNSIDEPIPGFSGKLLSEVPQWLSKVITENVSKPCLSTGLKDSQGKEVFFGDVLCDADGYLYVVDWNDKHACFGMQHFSVDWDKNIYVTMSVCDTRRVVGNRFEPIETLNQRAGAVGDVN
jgi:hypothetical protein